MTPTLTALVVCPTPEPLAATPNDGGDAEYLALAKRLGVCSPFIVRRELEEALLAEGIRIYDKAAVKAWMDGLVAKENARLRAEWQEKRADERTRKVVPQSQSYVLGEQQMEWYVGPVVRWGWRALRTQDVMKGLLGEEIYPDVVPFAALETMDRILRRVPDAAFLISDYKVEVPDPFMMVTRKLLGPNGYVVERWNEPGFRG